MKHLPLPSAAPPEQSPSGHSPSSDSPSSDSPAGHSQLLISTGQRIPLQLQLADRFVSRLIGLMGRRGLRTGPVPEGLLITRCASVHSGFMRFAIDVVYLDATGVIVRCVENLQPWRCSAGRRGMAGLLRREGRAEHTLELPAGTVHRTGLKAGDRLEHPVFDERSGAPTTNLTPFKARQRGAAMVEFTLVGPLVLALGLGILQYGLLFVAKNQLDHAAFMATRAGSMANASLDAVKEAYAQALIPIYGGGTDTATLAASYLKAQTDVDANTRIELLNPTKESFDDHADPALTDSVGHGHRVIPNSGQTMKSAAVNPHSGQNIQDANLLKIRITHGYEPKIPLVSTIYKKYLQWLDPGTDAFNTALIHQGRVPVVSHVVLHMQSDAIEPDDPVSNPGPGNHGQPVDPGDPPVTRNDPPDCGTMGCTVPSTPYVPPNGGGEGDDGGGGGDNGYCPIPSGP